MKTHVWSTYGVENLTISKTMVKSLEAMEIWLWSKMMMIPWTAGRLNEEVLEMVREEGADWGSEIETTEILGGM